MIVGSWHDVNFKNHIAVVFLNSSSEAEHVPTVFLFLWQIEPWCPYEVYPYKENQYTGLMFESKVRMYGNYRA